MLRGRDGDDVKEIASNDDNEIAAEPELPACVGK